MGTIKQIYIKNRTYYFYNDVVDIKTLDSNLLKIDKKSYKDIGIYNIGYITIKKIDDYENIYSVNPLYLTITHASGYIEVTKTDFDAKLSGLHRKITKNKTDHLIIKSELNKLKTFDLGQENVKNYFEEDEKPNYLIFPPLNKYFKLNIHYLSYVSSWTSKGFSDESIKPLTTLDNNLTPIINYYGPKIKVSFDVSCKVTFNHRKIVNIYIVYDIIDIANINGSKDSKLTIKNALFEAVSLTKNADVDKHKYSRYRIAFDGKGSFSFPAGGDGQNVITFGADMNYSPHIDNKGKDILILGIGPTQGLGEHSLTAEKMYSINFTKEYTKFCLSLHYNGANSYLFVNGTEIIKFKAKDSNIVARPLCLGNISKDWSTDNKKKKQLYWLCLRFQCSLSCY